MIAIKAIMKAACLASCLFSLVLAEYFSPSRHGKQGAENIFIGFPSGLGLIAGIVAGCFLDGLGGTSAAHVGERRIGEKDPFVLDLR